jgi:site-specific recombinase XerD
MLTAYFKDPHTLARYRQGPAGPTLEDFVAWLAERGYQRGSVRRAVRAAHHFALWAADTGLTLPQLDRTALAACGEHLQRHHRLKYAGGNSRHGFVGAGHFVDFLAETDRLVCPQPAVSITPEPALLATFRRWMSTQRGTLAVTLDNYRLTLLDLLQRLGDQPERYDAQALRAFVHDRASRYGLGHAKQVVTAVRMFLRFLVATGQCAAGLDQAIPTIAHWRLARLPKYLSGEAVERVIASCDLTVSIGVRDRAVLLLLARLGLRAGDVADLRLAAIDWQAGTVLVAGKNRRQCRLPLPQDAGDAILAYLEQRPVVDDGHVFVTAVAPIKGLSYQTVGQIVTRAMHRADIQAPIHGARLLRHSAATRMLREGMSLPAIGVVLRHASVETTAVYAKVDVQLLRQIARPWPEVTSC